MGWQKDCAAQVDPCQERMGNVNNHAFTSLLLH